MSKVQRLMGPFTLSKAELIKLGESHENIKKYVDAVLPLLENGPEDVVGTAEVRNANDLPVLLFTPKKVQLSDLIKNKLIIKDNKV